VPALRLAASTRDAVPRWFVSKPASSCSTTRASSALGTSARSPAREPDPPARVHDERAGDRLLEDASESFERYYGTVGQIQALLARGQRVRAAALSEGASRALADRIEASLEALTESMHADVLQAQAEVARLEARTWSGRDGGDGAAVGLALLGSGLVAHRMTQSLQKLSAATSAVAAGSFEEPIAVEGRDEVGQLARSFSAMARELRRMEETKEDSLHRSRTSFARR